MKVKKNLSQAKSLPNISLGTHRELAELGIDYASKVAKMLPKLDAKDITAGKICRLRNPAGGQLDNELKEIDKIVKVIMKM